MEHIYIPAKEKVAGRKSPVLLMLHGVGSNEKDLANLGGAIDPRFAVYSLRAPLTLGPSSFAWFHVNFTEKGPLHNREEAEASRQKLVQFIQSLKENPDIDPSQVFLVGFSQGTIMSLSLALTEPSLIKGVVAISGRTLQEIQQIAKEREYKNPPPVLLLHGVNDNKLPFTHAQTTEETLKQAHFQVDFKRYLAGHEITPEMKRDLQDWLSRSYDFSTASK